jgi:hypothetical protein
MLDSWPDDDRWMFCSEGRAQRFDGSRLVHQTLHRCSEADRKERARLRVLKWCATIETK